MASPLAFGADPASLHGARVRAADVLIGGDLIVSASAEALDGLSAGRTRAVVNTANAPTADFVRNPDWQFPAGDAERAITRAVGEDDHVHFIDARALAVALLGDAIYANPLLHAQALEMARIPEQIRGYGHVKQRHLAAARARHAEAMARWRAPARENEPVTA